MTKLTEAKLAREAEICYATLALVTDYDCWHEVEADVSVSGVLEVLRENAALAASTLRGAVRALPRVRHGCGCGDALRHAIITPLQAVDAAARARLGVLLDKYASA
jgi:5'-methylthioadenosine phosphorylase